MASTNKCLAQRNRSSDRPKATKERSSARRKRQHHRASRTLGDGNEASSQIWRG
jgi:hypothetical protein